MIVSLRTDPSVQCNADDGLVFIYFETNDLIFHRIRCIVSDMTTSVMHVPSSSNQVTGPAPTASLRTFLKRVRGVLAPLVTFTGTATLQDLNGGNSGSGRCENFCPSRHEVGDKYARSASSPPARRDVKKNIRSQRALLHVPFDVELARTLAVDRSRAPHSWLR
jgi:hypothetical protein